MKNLVTVAGPGLISHFEPLWIRQDLFRYEWMRLNRYCTGELIQNVIYFIAFSLVRCFPQQDPALHLQSQLPDVAGLVSPTYFTITVRITERQFIIIRSSHTPYTNNLITVKTISSSPTAESAIFPAALVRVTNDFLLAPDSGMYFSVGFSESTC